MIKSIITFLLIISFTCFLGLALGDNKGIVALAGYEHAVAMCEGGEDIPMHRVWGGTQYREDGVMYIINEGHKGDPALMQLKELAKWKCAFYLSE